MLLDEITDEMIKIFSESEYGCKGCLFVNTSYCDMKVSEIRECIIIEFESNGKITYGAM